MTEISEWLSRVDDAYAAQYKEALDADEKKASDLIAAGATLAEMARFWKENCPGLRICAKDGYPMFAKCRWAVKKLRSIEMAAENAELKAYWENKHRQEEAEQHRDRLGIGSRSRVGMRSGAEKRRQQAATVLAL